MARGFSYFTFDGVKITDPVSLERIRSLVIPPAWNTVRISPFASSKLQAVGIDTSGRIQYIYHTKFSEQQGKKKFARIERFGEYMPALRRATNEHIALKGFPKEKVLALMTRLINSLYIRMGTDRSVKNYRTYGITTLGKRHVQFVRGGTIVFDFVGKSRVKHRKVLVDSDIAALLKKVASIGRGRKLFQYLDTNEKPRPVKPSEINTYIRSITCDEYSAKDFRTWGASMLAALEFAEMGPAADERQLKKNIVAVTRRVAEELGNTPTVCRSSYIHPNIIKAYSNGETLESFTPRSLRKALMLEPENQPAEIALMKLFAKYR